MRTWSRLVLGALAVAFGVAAWIVVGTGTNPTEVGPPATETGVPFWLPRQEASVAMRLGAVAVAVGGLLLAVRGWRIGAALAVGLGGAWLGADMLLTLSGVDSLTAAASVVVAVAVAAVALLLAARGRGNDPAPAWWLLAAAGVLVGLQTLAIDSLVPGPALWVRPVLPAVLIGLAVFLALAAGPAPAPASRIGGAALVTGLLTVAAVVPPATGPRSARRGSCGSARPCCSPI